MKNKRTVAAGAGKIAVLLPSLEGGGAERSMLTLVKAFLARGRSVDLVLCKAKGAYLKEIPEGATLVELRAAGTLKARWDAAICNLPDFFPLLYPVLLAKKTSPEIARIRSLQQYVNANNPDIVLSALPYANLLAIWGKHISTTKVPVVVSERNSLSTYCAAPTNYRKWRWRYLPRLIRRTYTGADAIVTVSNHVAEDLKNNIQLVHPHITTIYNPVVDDSLRDKAGQDLDHPWFSHSSTPVILGVGRLTEQKDFPTLIRAFALVRATRQARLVILGEGRLRQQLEKLAGQLGVEEDVDMPGFVSNPLQYMARASVFVLSSEYEGLPGVLIQALACGCPVVSTNCPGGSAEILVDSKYGALTGIGDAVAMAKAITAQLDEPTPKDILLQRAEDFSVEQAVDNYLALLDSVVDQRSNQHQASD